MSLYITTITTPVTNTIAWIFKLKNRLTSKAGFHLALSSCIFRGGGQRQYLLPRGEGLPYENDGDARRKIRINTLKETNLGVAPALFNP